MGKAPAEKLTRTGPAPMDPNKNYVNPKDDDQMEIEGFRVNYLKKITTWFFILITLGFLRLVFYWCPDWMIRCTHSVCALTEAEVVLLKDQYKQWFVSRVWTVTRDGTQVKVLSYNSGHRKSRYNSQTPLNRYKAKESVTPGPQSLDLDDESKDESLMKYFISKKVKYIWDSDREVFQKIRGLEENISCSYFHETMGSTTVDQEKRRVLYGMNEISVHVTPIFVLLFKQILSPFYIFQVFSCSLWYADEYYYYASAIVLMSVTSIVVTIYQTRKMQRALRNTITASTIVTIWRGGDAIRLQRIPSPGPYSYQAMENTFPWPLQLSGYREYLPLSPYSYQAIENTFPWPLQLSGYREYLSLAPTAIRL
ncbi:hypothetical protein ScPMuIL_008067 [Solemya velum]